MKKAKYVTLNELKKQMRVDFEEEDDLIQTFGAAAEDSVLRGTGRTDEELLQMGWKEEHPDEDAPEQLDEEFFPSRLKVAILILAAHFYRNREAVAGVAQNIVPYAYEVLTKPYKKLSNRG